MSDLVNKAMGFFQKIPAAPTNPQDSKTSGQFTIKDLYSSEEESVGEAKPHLDEKLRQAYFWITNTAIISPYYDIEYEEEDARHFTFGDSKVELSLPKGQSYSSFVLIPLLNLVVQGKCLIVGGPGRGKTTTSVLMGLLAGYL